MPGCSSPWRCNWRPRFSPRPAIPGSRTCNMPSTWWTAAAPVDRPSARQGDARQTHHVPVGRGQLRGTDGSSGEMPPEARAEQLEETGVRFPAPPLARLTPRFLLRAIGHISRHSPLKRSSFRKLAPPGSRRRSRAKGGPNRIAFSQHHAVAGIRDLSRRRFVARSAARPGLPPADYYELRTMT
jgi:hypothetical protein